MSCEAVCIVSDHLAIIEHKKQHKKLVRHCKSWMMFYDCPDVVVHYHEISMAWLNIALLNVQSNGVGVQAANVSYRLQQQLFWNTVVAQCCTGHLT